MDSKRVMYLLSGIGVGLCVGLVMRGRGSMTRQMKTATRKRKSTSKSQVSSSGSSDEGTTSDSREETKLIMIVRQDLKMGKGKIAAQCAHAAVAAYKQASKQYPVSLKSWEHSGQPKVVVKCNTEEELLELYRHAQVLKLTASVIQDGGHTQVMPGTKTVLAVGPGTLTKVNTVTGHLKLL